MAPTLRANGGGAAPSANSADKKVEDLYALLRIPRDATPHEVRRAYKTLRTSAHPDKKGGDPAAFSALTRAFEVLSDPQSRALYDATGRTRVHADERFAASFDGGAFADPLLRQAERQRVRRQQQQQAADGGGSSNVNAVLLLSEDAAAAQPSHTAGFEAWLRARGPGGGLGNGGAPAVFGAEAVAEEFGVAEGSYDPSPTPRASDGGPALVPGVVCRGAGPLSQTLAVAAEPLPPALAFGEVLVVWLVAPVGPADVSSLRLGGVYGLGAASAPAMQPRAAPFAAGHDGVGVVAMVGPGVGGGGGGGGSATTINIGGGGKGGALAEGDLVSPSGPFAGTWRAAAVLRAKDVTRLGTLAGLEGAGGAPAWLDAVNGGGAAASAILRDAAAAAAAAANDNDDDNKPSANEMRRTPKTILSPSSPAPSPSSSPSSSSSSMLLPLEYMAVWKELLAAFRLLEATGSLRPGDCVCLNAPDSTVGRCVLQIARVLRLRTVALLRPRPSRAAEGAAGGVGAGGGGRFDEARFEAVAERLKGLGATHVLRDEGAVEAQLASLSPPLFGRPALALDAVGGDSSSRLAALLADGGTMIVYGGLSGRPPLVGWQHFASRDLRVRGFSSRAYAAAEPRAAARALGAVARLVAAGRVELAFAEYDLAAGEWADAADHASGEGGAPRGGAKALLVLPGLSAALGGSRFGGAPPA